MKIIIEPISEPIVEQQEVKPKAKTEHKNYSDLFKK